MQPRILAHGGAWYWDDSLDADKRRGMEAAVLTGYEILRNGGTALDAIEKTVMALENDPVFDAGTGGYLNRDGVVQLDALIADGQHLDFGSIAAVSRIRNPIEVARLIMERTPHHLYVGTGAEDIAEMLGVPLVDNSTLITPAMRAFAETQSQEGHDTVGAVAIDKYGHLAVGTSTSGSPYKHPGRVGDSPLFGSGGYADDTVGAAGATGNGEHIMRLLLSKRTCDLIDRGCTAQEAALEAMADANRRFEHSMCGVIVVDHHGNIGVAHSTPKIALGWVAPDGTLRSATQAHHGFPDKK